MIVFFFIGINASFFNFLLQVTYSVFLDS